jgi:hypothetical protein
MWRVKHRAPTEPRSRLIAGLYKHLVPPGPKQFFSNTLLPTTVDPTLLDFPLFYLIMRHFATQKLATGSCGSESKKLSSNPEQQRAFLPLFFSLLELITHKLPEVSEAR